MRDITVTLHYQLNREFLESLAVSQGKAPEAEQLFTFQLADVAPEMRQKILDAGRFDVKKGTVSLVAPLYETFALGYLVDDTNYTVAVSEFCRFMQEYRRKQEQEERKAEERRAAMERAHQEVLQRQKAER